MTSHIGKKPTQAKQLLPVECYTSEAWFEREQKELFNKVWTFACTFEDVSQPGDYYATQVGEFPIVVIHGRDGTLRAFHNICRHRGSILLEGQGNIERSIICSYHRWAYSTDGKLRGVPQQRDVFKELDKCELSLKGASLENYRNLIFVHAEEKPAENFATYLGDVMNRSWPAKTENLQVISRMSWEINCNWKVFIENAEDGYHLMHLHKNTLGGPGIHGQEWTPLGRHWLWEGKEPIVSGLATQGDEGEYDEQQWQQWIQQFNPIEGVDPMTFGGQVYIFFPAFGLQPLLDNVGFFKLTPLSASKTLFESFITMKPCDSEEEKQSRLEQLHAFAPMPGIEVDKDGLANQGKPIKLSDVDGHPLDSGNFHIEDVWQVELIQKAMRSPAFEVGPLSNGEGETALTYFQQNILDYVPLNKASTETLQSVSKRIEVELV